MSTRSEYMKETNMKEKEFLKSYDPNKYQRPSVTTDVIVLTTSENYRFLRILLIKRKNFPFKDCWAIPGGFVNIDEELEAAAKRELKEETGLSPSYIEQLYTFGGVDRDPRTRVISVSYLALLNFNKVEEVCADDDAAEAEWFTVSMAGEKGELYTLVSLKTNEQLKPSDLAFDHGEIIKLAIQRIKGKLEYTDIGFNLLPEKFTQGQAQRVYEAILGHPIHPSNFRRSIADMIEKTDDEKVVFDNAKASSLYRLKNKKSLFD